jgi:hypothetical protein
MMKFRRATDDEIVAIKEEAAKRKALEKEARKEFRCPEAATSSVEGGVFWALIEKWQDSPVYVIASFAALVWVITMLLIDFVHSVAHLF